MINLSGKKVAILTENGFEESELTSPKRAMEEAGAIVHIVSPQEYQVKGWKDGNWSIELPVDITLPEADGNDYDGIVIPGGVINPDLMRRNDDCVEFVQHFMTSGKMVAAICHGPQLLIETRLLEGKRMTSFSSIRTDLENAGADWVDMEVVVDNGLVTSRSPEDLEAFNSKIIEELMEGVHEHSF
ncbi:MAG: type 1 glutamine amidotransferase domain-containing protein [Bacteroidota bacterium]